MGEVSKRIKSIRNQDIKGAIEELWTKMKNNEGGEYAMCGVMQVRLIDILYKGEMELRDGEDRTILRILRKIGEGVRNMIKLYVELKGVHTAIRELRQTNIIGFFGKKGRGVERPRSCSTGINKMGIGNTEPLKISHKCTSLE